MAWKSVYNAANDDYEMLEVPDEPTATATTSVGKSSAAKEDGGFTPSTSTPTATPTDKTAAPAPATTGVTPSTYDPANADPSTKGFNLFDTGTWFQQPIDKKGMGMENPQGDFVTPTDTSGGGAPPPPPPPPPEEKKKDEPPPPPATNPYGVADPTYAAQGGKMLSGAEDSYGANATEAMTKALASGRTFGDIAAAEGGRNATGFARASGLSPAQAALMAGQGAEGAYNTGLGQGVDKYMGAARDIGNLGLGEQSQGLQKYGLDLGKYGTDVGAQGQKYGIDKGVATQNTSNWMNMLGTGASAAATLLPLFLKDGTDSAPGGLAVVGEEGPELVNLPSGSQVVPHGQTKKLIKDGYDILSAVTDSVGKRPAKVEQVAKVSLQSAPAKTSGKEMSDKLDKVFSYLKAAQ